MKKTFWLILVILTLGLIVSCATNPSDGGTSSDSTSSTTSSVTSESTSSTTSSTTSSVTSESTSSTTSSTTSSEISSSSAFSANVAINLDFETSTGGPYTAKGTPQTDHATLSNIAGHNAIYFNAIPVEQYGSTGVEIQWDLNGTQDFSDEKYVFSLDLYVPAGSKSSLSAFQFEFFRDDWSAVYSTWFGGSIDADTWTHYDIPITAANIGYPSGTVASDLTNFVKVRIQFIANQTNTEVEFFVDNLTITNKP